MEFLGGYSVVVVVVVVGEENCFNCCCSSSAVGTGPSSGDHSKDPKSLTQQVRHTHFYYTLRMKMILSWLICYRNEISVSLVSLLKGNLF